jgi:guanylate kinase
MSALFPVVIVSGPSGSGKSTVIARVLEGSGLPARLAVSATTRAPRPGEKDGVHYHFWTRQQFEAGLAQEEFLEWAQVHGNYYGTPRREVEPYRRQMIVLLDIDVQGTAQIRLKYPDAVTVFLRTSSLAEYEARLRKRGTEDEAGIQRRLEGARAELSHANEYKHQVINDDLDSAVAQLREIIQQTLQRTSHVR